MSKNFLLVCTGNTCRSSMGEALLKDLLAKANKDNCQVKSAGISAFEGENAAKQAVEVMREEGLDLSSHQTVLLSEQLIKEADVILTMTQRHKLIIIDDYPEFKNKTYTLKEYGARIKDVEEETNRIEELYQAIDRKREEFRLEYKEEIEDLENKRLELITQLEQVEQRLEELEKELNKRVSVEKRELAKFRDKLGDSDVCDPFGQPISVYRNCAQEIKSELQKIVENLE